METTNDYSCGGGNTHTSDCPMDELKIMYKEIVIDKNLKNDTSEVKCPLEPWDDNFSSGN